MNAHSPFIADEFWACWRYFYGDPDVVRAHVETYGATVYLPLIVR